MTGRAARAGRSIRTGLLVRLAICVAAALVSGCGDDSAGPQPPMPDPFFPANYLETYPLVRRCRLSIDHDSWHIRVYVNPEAFTAYTDSIYPFAESTVLVKPLYSDTTCTQVVEYAVMRKGPPGTAPASADWEWQRVGADRKVLESGQIQRCITCHRSCTNGRDYACTDPLPGDP